MRWDCLQRRPSHRSPRGRRGTAAGKEVALAHPDKKTLPLRDAASAAAPSAGPGAAASVCWRASAHGRRKHSRRAHSNPLALPPPALCSPCFPESQRPIPRASSWWACCCHPPSPPSGRRRRCSLPVAPCAPTRAMPASAAPTPCSSRRHRCCCRTRDRLCRLAPSRLARCCYFPRCAARSRREMGHTGQERGGVWRRSCRRQRTYS
mmetsp:Transcript_32409/g.81563  ORF Transcript_32409/g.81563 Transcript_32409/m.81563 type:complete len:207 (+) Transcript_32409:133-753(+)